MISKFKTMVMVMAGLCVFVCAKDNSLLSVGTVAPGFSLMDQSGTVVTLGDYKGRKSVVLIFYPGDQTPGCTQQLCEMRDDYSRFETKNAVVFGINPADKKSHTAFVKKIGLQFPLLIDSNKTAATAYGCNGFMINRTVYIIDTAGVIIFSRRGKPATSELLKAIP